MYRIRQFFYKLKKLYIYGKHLWTNDYDWDWCYLLELMDIKFKFMEQDSQKAEKYCASAEDNTAQIQLCRQRIARILADDYCREESAPHKAQWGDLEMVYGQADGQGRIPVTFKYSNAVTPADFERATTESLAISQLQDLAQQQDITNLFEHIAVNLRNWWS